MGCDIHLYVERRVDDKWLCADQMKRDEPEDGESQGYLSADYNALFYKGRNYNLFAILADVRNGRGFAGVKTGDGFNPIAEPRGLPDDASPEVREISDRWDGDGHSHSYFTLRELLDYDWTQRTALQGWVEAAEWSKWSRWARAQGNGPDSYCGGVSGANVKHISAEEMDALVKDAPHENQQEEYKAFFAPLAGTYALAKWGVAYYDAAGEFISETIPRLLKLAGGTQGLDDVRIVFLFDN